jgi:hypothetical protein
MSSFRRNWSRSKRSYLDWDIDFEAGWLKQVYKTELSSFYYDKTMLKWILNYEAFLWIYYYILAFKPNWVHSK